MPPKQIRKSESHFAHKTMTPSSKKLQIDGGFSLWRQESEDAFLLCPQIGLTLGKHEFDYKKAD